MNLPIDFNALRVALVRAVMAATGLDQNHVIMAEPETPNAPRPTRPYVTLKITSPSVRYGGDTTELVSGTTYNYGGPRMMMVSFNCYGVDHEDAYGFLTLWQAALGMEPTLARLREAGIAVWLPGAVTDLSALLDTGYEGRAHMDVRFGIASNVQADLGQIATAAVQGVAQADVVSGSVDFDRIQVTLGG